MKKFVLRLLFLGIIINILNLTAGFSSPGSAGSAVSTGGASASPVGPRSTTQATTFTQTNRAGNTTGTAISGYDGSTSQVPASERTTPEYQQSPSAYDPYRKGVSQYDTYQRPQYTKTSPADYSKTMPTGGQSQYGYEGTGKGYYKPGDQTLYPTM